MNRLIRAVAIRLAAGALASVAAPGCNGSAPTPFNQDGGSSAPAGTSSLTIGFIGTGTGSVSLVSDAVDGGPTSCTARCTKQYPSSATVNLTTTADSDSIFDGWDPATSDPSCPTVSLATSVTCTATFDKLVAVPGDGGPVTDSASPSDAAPADSATDGKGD